MFTSYKKYMFKNGRSDLLSTNSGIIMYDNPEFDIVNNLNMYTCLQVIQSKNFQKLS